MALDGFRLEGSLRVYTVSVWNGGKGSKIRDGQKYLFLTILFSLSLF